LPLVPLQCRDGTASAFERVSETCCLGDGLDPRIEGTVLDPWLLAYESLKRTYGDIEMPGIKVAPSSEAVTTEVLALAAGANTDATGETQMAPVRQPIDMFVFSSFARRDTPGARFYYVIMNIDRHP